MRSEGRPLSRLLTLMRRRKRRRIVHRHRSYLLLRPSRRCVGALTLEPLLRRGSRWLAKFFCLLPKIANGSHHLDPSLIKTFELSLGPRKRDPNDFELVLPCQLPPHRIELLGLRARRRVASRALDASYPCAGTASAGHRWSALRARHRVAAPALRVRRRSAPSAAYASCPAHTSWRPCASTVQQSMRLDTMPCNFFSPFAGNHAIGGGRSGRRARIARRHSHPPSSRSHPSCNRNCAPQRWNR